MKNLLVKMIVENFKGILRGEFSFSEICEKIGSNETGKSTIVDAYFWAHDGKDRRFKENYGIRHNTRPGDPRVTLIYENIKLRKTFGQTKAGGNVILYEIDKGLGFDVINLSDTKIKGDNVKGYQSYIDKMFPMFRMCSDINYFSETMKTEDARKFVLKMGGVPAKEEIYKYLSQNTIEILEKILENYGINEALRTLRDKVSDLTEERKKLKGEIEGREKDIKNLTPNTPLEILENQREVIERKIETLNNRLKEISVGGDLLENLTKAKNAKATAESDIFNENRKNKNEYQKKIDEIENAYQAECQIEDRKFFERKREFDNKKKELEMILKKKNEIETLLAEKKKAVDSLEVEKEKKFDERPFRSSAYNERSFDHSGKCNECGKPYLPEEMEDIKSNFEREETKRRTEFYEAENRRRADHEKQQARNREIFENMRSRAVEDCNKRIERIEKELAEANRIDFEAVEKELSEMIEPVKNKIIRPALPFEPEEKKIDLLKYDEQILDAARKIDAVNIDIKERQKPILEEIETEKELLKGTLEHIAKYESVKILEKTQKTTEERYKKNLEEKEAAEIKIDAIKEYNKSLAEIVKSKTREIFGAEIELYRQQVNGDLKEDFIVLCDTKEGPVPYAFANSASRIKTGLRIIEKLQKMFDSYPMVFVDNSEAVEKFDDLKISQICFMTVKPIREIKERNYFSIEEFNSLRREENKINR